MESNHKKLVNSRWACLILAGMVAALEVCFMLGQRYLIIQDCKTAFGEAMTEEKDKFITLIVFQYDSRNTEDGNPKMRWKASSAELLVDRRSTSPKSACIRPIRTSQKSV